MRCIRVGCVDCALNVGTSDIKLCVIHENFMDFLGKIFDCRLSPMDVDVDNFEPYRVHK